MRPSYFLLALALWTPLIPGPAAASNIDGADTVWMLRKGRLFRLDYANDFFAGMDRYYTQGYGLHFFHPAVAQSPLAALLLELPEGDSSHGGVFRHCGFTPSRLDSDAPLGDDRPFAGYLFVGQSILSNDSEKGLTLTSELDIGFIGPWAGGKQIQTGLHRALGNFIPRGWDNQVGNDIVLDYYVRLEKRVAKTAGADAGLYADGTLGTLYANAAAGLVGRLGQIERSGHRFFLFGHAEAKAVGRDATLQGGVFNRSSPHTLSADRIERGVFYGDLGVVFERERYALQFKRSFKSREFKGGMAHQSGEFSVAWYF